MAVYKKLALLLGLLAMIQPLAIAVGDDAGQIGVSSDEPSRFRILNFGVTERLTTQSSFSGINLSTLLTWNPHFQVTPWLNFEGQLGATFMTSNLGTFVAGRYQVGGSIHRLFQSFFNDVDRLVPEVLVGLETWAISAGGTYFSGSVNFHYRFHFKEMGILNLIDAVHFGYQWLPGAPYSARQYTIGIRIVPFAEERIK